MRSLRFGLAVIAYCGLGLAALRSPSQLWASSFFALTWGVLALAIVNVIYSRERQRAFWVGFLVCGGVYFVAALGPWFDEEVGSRLVTTALLDILYPEVVAEPRPPQASGGGMAAMMGGDMGMMPGMSGMGMYGGAAPAAPVAEPTRWSLWAQPRRSQPFVQVGHINLASTEPFRRVGHSLFTLLVATLGGCYARHRFSRMGGNEAKG